MIEIRNINMNVKNFDDFVKKASNLLIKEKYINDALKFKKLIYKRENLGNTMLSEKVKLPHIKSEIVLINSLWIFESIYLKYKIYLLILNNTITLKEKKEISNFLIKNILEEE